MPVVLYKKKVLNLCKINKIASVDAVLKYIDILNMFLALFVITQQTIDDSHSRFYLTNIFCIRPNHGFYSKEAFIQNLYSTNYFTFYTMH